MLNVEKQQDSEARGGSIDWVNAIFGKVGVALSSEHTHGPLSQGMCVLRLHLSTSERASNVCEGVQSSFEWICSQPPTRSLST
jgi:hypothetical protein